MKILYYICLIVSTTILVASCDKKSENYSPEQQAAIDSAIAWLILVDEGKYEQSWQIAAQSFKKDVTERQWGIGLKHMRAPYGGVESHEIRSCNLSNYQSHSGKHQSAFAEFQTTFENQNMVTEFLTLQLVNDTWRVSSYYLDR